MAEKNDNTKTVCSICLNDFHQPKVIDCKHTFCRACLEDYVKQFPGQDKFNCPLCRRDVKIPVGGVKAFPSNCYVTETLRADNSKHTASCRNCGFCQKAISPSYRCQNCDKYICELCKKIHDKVNETKSHIIQTLTDHQDDDIKAEFCHTHKQHVEFYCEDCQVTVCSICFISHHNGHVFQNLHSKTVQNKGRKELKHLTEKFESQLVQYRDYYNTLNMTSKDLQDAAKFACVGVDEQVKHIHAMYIRIGEDLKDEITETSEQEQSKLDQLMNATKDTIHKKKLAALRSRSVLTSKSTVRVKNLIPEIHQETEDHDPNDLMLPKITFPYFKKEHLFSEDHTSDLGVFEMHNGPTFQHTFNLDDFNQENGNRLTSKVCWILELPWYISCLKDTEEATLGIFLGLNEQGNEDSKVASCYATICLTLINLISEDVCMDDDLEFVPGGTGQGDGSFIDWNVFSDPSNNFVDGTNNGAFTVQATINVKERETRD